MSKCKNRAPQWCYYKLMLTTHEHKADTELPTDEVTWKHVILNSLKRSHGVFGEAIECEVLISSDNIAFVRVAYDDRQYLSSALTTYVSDQELVGAPALVVIIQETDKLTELEVEDSDRLWLNKCIEMEKQDDRCE